ncbi:MAG: type II secretion system protein [Pseudomonadota bacterium]
MGAGKKANRGFSLVELSILLVFAGIVGGTTLQLYKESHRQRYVSDTGYRGEAIQTALDKFLTENGRLPCPAKPTLGPSEADSGKEICLTVSGCVADGRCLVDGGRDTSADVDADVDEVYIGSIPYVTLNLPIEVSMDGWGNKFLYAVSKYLTDPATYSPPDQDPYGVIDIEVPNAAAAWVPTPKTTYVDGVATVYATPFVVLSHGENGVGAYNLSGKRRLCSGTDAGLDLFNCGNTGVFYDYSQHRSLRPGPDYFDDKILVTSNNMRIDRWGYSNVVSKSIYNTANSSVGIGTDQPDMMLDVNGSLRAQRTLGDQYCDGDGDNCFPAKMIGGAGVTCGANGAVNGIKEAEVVCVPKVNPTGLASGTCPSGQYVKGFNAAGSIICGTP